MGLLRGIWEVVPQSRVGFAVLRLLGSVAVFAACIGSSILLDWLMGYAVDTETDVYLWINTVMDVVLLGTGALVTIGGCIVVVVETWTSTMGVLGRMKENR